MAITKKPAVVAARPGLEQFIEAAPDGAKPAAAKSAQEEGVQITLRLSRAQLERIGKVAKRQGIPRASYIKRSVFVQLEADERSRE